MDSLELDTKAEIANLVNRIIRLTIADAQRLRACGSALPTLNRSAESLGELLKGGYTFTVGVERRKGHS